MKKNVTSRKHPYHASPYRVKRKKLGLVEKIVTFLVVALILLTLIYMLFTSRDSWISMGSDRMMLPFLISSSLLSPFSSYYFFKQSKSSISYVKSLRVLSIATALLPFVLILYLIPVLFGSISDHLYQYKHNPVLTSKQVSYYDNFEVRFTDQDRLVTIKTPTPTKDTYSKKLNIQYDVAPGEPAYVTYKRIRIDNSLVHENRYAAVVIHAPKDS